MRSGGRDRGLAWVAERVREAGGLVGAGPRPWPVRPIEVACAALALGFACGALWPRRGVVAALGVALILVVAAPPAQRAWVLREARGVVREPVELSGPGIELQPGQVVTWLGRRRDGVRVRAGRGVEGVVPAGAIDSVGIVP
jgi:hypothetical protein